MKHWPKILTLLLLLGGVVGVVFAQQGNQVIPGVAGVSSVSCVSGCSVANPTTTPAITVTSVAVACGGLPALTGDVTTSAGSCSTTVAKIMGTTVSSTTGTTNAVFSNGPTLVSPALGTPSALVLSNATGLPCGAMPAMTGDTTTSAGSCGTTTTKINGTSFAGTSTHLVAFGASNTPADSGIVDTAAGLLAACTGCAPLASPSFTTPSLGAATASSLLATGIVDGEAPVTVTTGTTGTPGATYNSGYTFNEESTAGTGVTYTLPTAAAGKQYCMANAYNGTGANTGTITVQTSASGQYIIFTDGTLSTSGGYVSSGGAAADAGCVVGVDTTHWFLYVQSGTWAKH